MKKLLFTVFIFVMAVSAFGQMMHNRPAGGYMYGNMCWFCVNDVEFKVTDIENGASVLVTAKGTENIIELQERADQWVNWHKEAGGNKRLKGMMGKRKFSRGMTAGGMCPFCIEGVSMEVKNTDDGVVLTVKDKKYPEGLRESVKNWASWHEDMADNMINRGMMMHGMGPGMMPREMGPRGKFYPDRRYDCMGNMMDPSWGNHMGNFWFGGVIMWIFWVLLIILLVVLIMKFAGKGGGAEKPIDVLKKRYAKGEITKKQFDKMKKDLE